MLQSTRSLVSSVLLKNNAPVSSQVRLPKDDAAETFTYILSNNLRKWLFTGKNTEHVDFFRAFKAKRIRRNIHVFIIEEKSIAPSAEKVSAEIGYLIEKERRYRLHFILFGGYNSRDYWVRRSCKYFRRLKLVSFSFSTETHGWKLLASNFVLGWKEDEVNNNASLIILIKAFAHKVFMDCEWIYLLSAYDENPCVSSRYLLSRGYKNIILIESTGYTQ